jgi:DNA-binding MarR family transcriptional regulator
MPSMEDSVKAMADAVSRIVEQWRAQRPDLDPAPMLVVGRIQRLSQLMDVELRPTFAEAGLGQGDFDILAALRRAGPGCSRTAGELRAALMVTSGAITKQVDRLAAKGLVTREVGEDDARVRRVMLTAAGGTLVDDLVEVHLAREQQLLAALTPDQAAQLAAILAVLAEDLETGLT